MSPSDLGYGSGVGGGDGGNGDDRGTRVQEMPYFIKRPLQDTSETPSLNDAPRRICLHL